jgi:DNA-directed RNA polymerase specialized sigma24 family protein
MSAESLDNLEKETGSVSHWLKGLKTGDRSAVDAIWHRYYQRIVQFAIRKMKVNPDRAVDGEDIAQITMHRFCSCVASGRYPNLDDREQLWALLVVFTINRIRKHLRSCSAQKRAGSHRSVFEFTRTVALQDLQAPEAPTIMADMVQCWLNRLDLEDPSGELRQIAIWSMEDISGSEIARILKKRKSYVLQQIRLIRLLWEECET